AAFKAANGGSATLAYNASVTLSVNYTAPEANAGGVIANTVTVNAADDEGDSAGASANDSVTYQDVTPSISITKTHTGTINEGTAGQVLTYSFTVSNSSTATTAPVAVCSLSLRDALPILAAFKAANGGSATLAYN